MRGLECGIILILLLITVQAALLEAQVSSRKIDEATSRKNENYPPREMRTGAILAASQANRGELNSSILLNLGEELRLRKRETTAIGRNEQNGTQDSDQISEQISELKPVDAISSLLTTSKIQPNVILLLDSDQTKDTAQFLASKVSQQRRENDRRLTNEKLFQGTTEMDPSRSANGMDTDKDDGTSQSSSVVLSHLDLLEATRKSIGGDRRAQLDSAKSSENQSEDRNPKKSEGISSAARPQRKRRKRPGVKVRPAVVASGVRVQSNTLLVQSGDEAEDGRPADPRGQPNSTADQLEASTPPDSPALVLWNDEPSEPQQVSQHLIEKGSEETPTIKASTLKRKSGNAGSPSLARETSLGIRVTTGRNSVPLMINSRGLITSAKGKLPFGDPNVRPYNPANSLVSQMDYSLSPTDKQSSFSAGTGKYRPVSGFMASDLDDRPTFLRQPVNISRPNLWAELSGSSSSQFAGETPESNLIDVGYQQSAQDELESSKPSNSRPSIRPQNNRNATFQVMSLHGLAPNASNVASSSPADFPTDDSNLNEMNELTSRNQTFQHNPPYTKLHQPNSHRVGLPTPLNDTLKSIKHRNTSRPQRKPIIQSRPDQDLNVANSSLTPLTADPLDFSSAVTSSALNDPQTNITLARPNQILRNKIQTVLIDKLLSSKLNHVYGAQPGNLSATVIRGSTGQNSQTRPTPAPLFSSTAANNLASLLAQSISQLVQPHGGKNSHSNRLHSFVTNRLKRRVNHLSNSQIDSAALINRRSTGVGNLLFSGFIYGLSVLPALMALTGNNPLNGYNLIDDSGSTSKRGGIASSQYGKARVKDGSGRIHPGQKISQYHPVSSTKPVGKDRMSHIGADSLLNTYLIPIDSLAPIPATTSTEIQDLRSALGLYATLNNLPAQSLDESHPLMDPDNEADSYVDEVGNSLRVQPKYSDVSRASPVVGSSMSSRQWSSTSEKPESIDSESSTQPSFSSNSTKSSVEENHFASSLNSIDEINQGAFTPLVLLPITPSPRKSLTNLKGNVGTSSGIRLSSHANVPKQISLEESLISHGDQIRLGSNPRLKYADLSTHRQSPVTPKVVVSSPKSTGLQLASGYRSALGSPKYGTSKPITSGGITILGPFDIGSQADQTVSIIPLNAIDLNLADSLSKTSLITDFKPTGRRFFFNPSSLSTPTPSGQPLRSFSPTKPRIGQMSYKPMRARVSKPTKKVPFDYSQFEQPWRFSKTPVRRQHEQAKVGTVRVNDVDVWSHLRGKSDLEDAKEAMVEAGRAAEPDTRSKRLAESEVSWNRVKSVLRSTGKLERSSPNDVDMRKRHEASMTMKGAFNDTLGELLLAHSLAMGSKILNERLISDKT